MLTYSTRDLPAKAKVSYWNDAVSSVFTPLEARPFDYSAFDADISCLNLGRIALAHVVSGAASIVHQVSHASRSTERKFFIQLHVRGRFAVSQDGKEVELEEGDFTFCDTSLPFTIHLGEATTTLVLSVPAAELKQYLPTPEQAICTKLSGKQGFSSVTSTML